MRIASLALVALAVTACKKSDEPPPPPSPGLKANDDKLVAEAKQFVKDADPKLRKLIVDQSLAEWSNETDITKEHEAAAAKASEIESVEITNMVKTAFNGKYDGMLAGVEVPSAAPSLSAGTSSRHHAKASVQASGSAPLAVAMSWPSFT